MNANSKYRLVPTLCVGMQTRAYANTSDRGNTTRLNMHSHAERGNEAPDK